VATQHAGTIGDVAATTRGAGGTASYIVDRALLAPASSEERQGAMPRRLGFFVMLAVVSAVIGFGRFAAYGLATSMRVVFIASLLLMFAFILFGRRTAT
jgi:hypothetical protein